MLVMRATATSSATPPAERWIRMSRPRRSRTAARKAASSRWRLGSSAADNVVGDLVQGAVATEGNDEAAATADGRRGHVGGVAGGCRVHNLEGQGGGQRLHDHLLDVLGGGLGGRVGNEDGFFH